MTTHTAPPDTIKPRPTTPPALWLARISAVLTLLLAVFGMLAATTVESLQTSSDALADSRPLFTAALIAWIVVVLIDIALSVTFYLLLRPVSQLLAGLTGALRLAYSAMLAALLPQLYHAYQLLYWPEQGTGLEPADPQNAAQAALDNFGTGFSVALVLFGLHLLALGILLYRSHYLPRVIAIVVALGGAGYTLDSLLGALVAGHGGPVSGILLTPAVLGEVGLALWLLIKGVNTDGGTLQVAPVAESRQ